MNQTQRKVVINRIISISNEAIVVKLKDIEKGITKANTKKLGKNPKFKKALAAGKRADKAITEMNDILRQEGRSRVHTSRHENHVQQMFTEQKPLRLNYQEIPGTRVSRVYEVRYGFFDDTEMPKDIRTAVDPIFKMIERTDRAVDEIILGDNKDEILAMIESFRKEINAF
jgi:hypothetical protein